MATWNILATSYIRREFYPQIPPEFLDPAWRVPALARRAAELAADILCLQEVEADAFAAIRDALGPEGYEGLYARKAHRRPDGCATFFRTARFTLTGERRIVYADGNGGRDSGHIAQLLLLEHDGRRLGILNTHLKWDQPGTNREDQWSYRQILLALSALNQAGPLDGRVLCGDFNVMPESGVIEALRAAGMDYAHRSCPGIATCNSNRQAKLIDYVFFSGALRATPICPPPIGNDTVLPSPDEPSDHLPLLTELELAR